MTNLESTPASRDPMGSDSATVSASLVSAGARRWYFGGAIGLLWLINIGFDIFGQVGSTGGGVLAIVFLVVYGAAFLVVPPVNWALPPRLRLLLPLALLGLSFIFWPWLGLGVYSVWAYVGISAAMSLVRMPVAVIFILAVGGLTATLAWLRGLSGDDIFAISAIITSVSLMMAAFARTIRSMNQLRATQHELARLAVEQERSRVARDMHDILGHSLTVITVKAELAGRLIESDPVRAGREISEVEELARGALADVRSTVAGYRGVSIASELVNARTALESAGIDATLPGSVDVVPAGYRELFGWVVREGVTNVVRHSKARRCTVALTASSVEVTDDGHPESDLSDATAGSGLAGLAERVAGAGLRLESGPLPGGGFRLRVAA